MGSNLDSFKEAFSCGQSIDPICECGEQYTKYDDDDYLTPMIYFEGKRYVYDCSCWHERATRIANWIDAHSHNIVAYMKAEKARLYAISDMYPVPE
jgi:hypothetical protein